MAREADIIFIPSICGVLSVLWRIWICVCCACGCGVCVCDGTLTRYCSEWKWKTAFDFQLYFCANNLISYSFVKHVKK